MKKAILSIDQVQELVAENKYKVEGKEKFFSRCIDGRYKQEKNLPPLAIPGADAGELALIFATANIFGFEVDEEKAFEALTELVGGVKNINSHTDQHGNPKIPASGCGHIKQIRLNPMAYNLEKDQIESITKLFEKAKELGSRETILEGEHWEGAIVEIKGNYSIYPGLSLETEDGSVETEIFVFHSFLINQRHKALTKALFKNKAVKLFPGCDEEYLFEVLSETTENHLVETAKRLAPGLPIYAIDFQDDGTFTVEDMGRV